MRPLTFAENLGFCQVGGKTGGLEQWDASSGWHGARARACVEKADKDVELIRAAAQATPDAAGQ